MFDYSNWAQPVTSKRWAFVASVLSHAKAASGYRLFVGESHRAWVKAYGLA